MEASANIYQKRVVSYKWCWDQKCRCPAGLWAVYYCSEHDSVSGGHKVQAILINYIILDMTFYFLSNTVSTNRIIDSPYIEILSFWIPDKSK